MRRPAPKSIQPEKFEFSKENLALAKKHIAKYPSGRQASAVLPLLDLAQRQNDNWVPLAAVEYIAQILEMEPIRVFEVVTFYTMFNLSPVGKYHIQICGTTPCWLSGSDKIKETCTSSLGINLNETTKDGLFSLVEVECLGACANAPMVQINDDYYEDLNQESMKNIIDTLAKGQKPQVGSQIGRKSSEPNPKNI